MKTRLLLLAVVLPLSAPGLAFAADEPTERGDRILEAYLRRQAKEIADRCLADVKTKEDWEKQRPELRRQFLEMMGLWPLPPKTDLKATVTGKIEAEHFTIEKLLFQSSPGLYVTGNLYVPKKAKLPAPAVLYVCGHGGTFIDKVSYGNKIGYQHHPAWLAEHGYVALVIDTLQLGEIQGLHHGTHNLNMWWWQTLGYTPAGIECWSAIRALDYLETRKEVDPKRLGVTGRSGGGATSWWLAAADDRVQCIIPVAGIADLWAHVVEGVAPRFQRGVISGHCDCMYMVNTYRWDFALVAALCAPRPLMLGNSDVDDIFPVPGYRRLADKVRKVYDLYGAGDKFVLLETQGPHKDTPELRAGAFGWLNKHLMKEEGEISDPERPRFEAKQLKVVARTPDDAVNATVHELFLKPASIEMPNVPAVAREWWAGRAPELMQGLKDKVFRNWPAQAPAISGKPAADVKHQGLRVRAFDFDSEEGVPLRLWLVTAEQTEKAKLVVLTAVDEPGWKDFVKELGPNFKEALQLANDPPFDQAKFEQNQRVLEKQGWALATIAPRGIGPTRWSSPDGKPDDTHVKRRFALLGQTLDSARAWDVRRGLEVLRKVDDLKGAPLWLQGKRDLAGVVLYAGLFEPDVVRFDLWHPPASHRDGPMFLNVRRVLDMPQAVALAFPRSVRIYVKDDAEAKAWDWPLQLQKALGKEHLAIRPVKD